MEITKKTAYPLANASEAIAGPGQNPTIPQPTPKVAEPIIKFLSIDLRVGIAKLSVNKGLFLYLNKEIVGALTIIAPNITKINEGSHSPNISRNPRTFSGLIMLEMDKPTPKMIPLIKELILDIAIFIQSN